MRKWKETEIGKIPEDWKLRRLDELGAIITGKTPKTANADNFGFEYPFITPRDMENQKKIHITERYLSEIGKNEVKNCLIPANSVCVSCIGSDMGKVIMTTKPSITNQQINSITPVISADYVYYSLRYISPQIKNLGKQSTAIPILNKTQFSKLQVPIPKNSGEIQVIAKILSDFDAKIELNRQMNKTLEQIGEALFKHWFVDFEFPNEEGKPYKSSGGKMVESELGAIPEGWKVDKLGSYISFNRGCSYTSDGLHDSENALVTLKSIERGGGFKADGFKPYTGAYKEHHVVKNGDIVVSHTDLTQNADVLGKPALVREVSEYKTLIASMDLGIVRPKNDTVSTSFLYHLLKTDQFQNHAYGYASGTTVLHLSSKAVPEFMFVLPPKEIVEQFSKVVDAMLIQMQFNSTEAEELANICDSLLPKLMSGQIRVPIEV